MGVKMIAKLFWILVAILVNKLPEKPLGWDVVNTSRIRYSYHKPTIRAATYSDGRVYSDKLTHNPHSPTPIPGVFSLEVRWVS